MYFMDKCLTSFVGRLNLTKLAVPIIDLWNVSGQPLGGIEVKVLCSFG
jgi:hypothetical protein